MFPRMVRDIAREKNKDIEFIISGSETSVDKKIIEEIKSPLMHIIRNSIDHGIELPEIRVKNGKNPQRKIFLSA
jgi:two-component system chemotaxis sensor kinase CheA